MRGRRRTALVGVLPVLLIAACDARPADVGGAADRTAEGRLVEQVRIDATESDLVPINRLTVRDDGVIAVNQAQDARVRFFSSTGEEVGAFGRRGQGPGEFVGLVRTGWRADTLWVFDPRESRVTLVGPDVSLVRTIQVPPAAEYELEGETWQYTSVVPQHVYDDGSFLASVMLPRGVDPPEGHGGTMYAHVGPDGRVLEPVVQPPGYECCFEQEGTVITLPFYERPRVEVSSNGSRIAVAWTAGRGEARDIHLTVLSDHGDGIVSLEHPIETVPLDRAVVDSAVEASARRLARWPQLIGGYEAAARDAAPPIHPPLEDLVLGRDGTVWVELYGEGQERIYRVFEATGEPMGIVRMPRFMRVAEAERNRAWVVERDELDLESVVRFDVEWD